MLILSTHEVDPATGEPSGKTTKYAVAFDFINMLEQRADGSIHIHLKNDTTMVITGKPSMTFDQIVDSVTKGKNPHFNATITFDLHEAGKAAAHALVGP